MSDNQDWRQFFPAQEDRPRSRRRYETLPTLAGEVIPGVLDGRDYFPFKSWAAAEHFIYPPDAAEFLKFCGSAAEAFFARPFTLRDGVTYLEERKARAGDFTLELQARCASFRIDALVSDGRTILAVEIDGLEFHKRTADQVTKDYLRERRIVAKGYPVARFTAREVFACADESWRQVEAILNGWRQK